MDPVKKLAGEIRQYCAAHANPELAARYARYFKEGFDSWGQMDGKHTLWTEKLPEWLERYRGLGLEGTFKLGVELFRGGKYEEGSVAIRFLESRLDEIDAAAFQKIGSWFEAGIGNWAHTDVLCGQVIGPLLERGRISLDSLAPWRAAPRKYQRRAVPVGMLNLLKKEKTVKPLLDFVAPLMEDPERVVQQGLGWFLRETWKKQPKPVETFLLEWKDAAPRLIFQYATEKMPKAGRERFRRAKARS